MSFYKIRNTVIKQKMNVERSPLDDIKTKKHQWYDIFVNCNWVATRWQQYSTHLHTNNTQNDTKQTVHRTTQKFRKGVAVPSLCGFYPDICLATEEKIRKKLSQGR
jgi:hypothetical protein